MALVDNIAKASITHDIVPVSGMSIGELSKPKPMEEIGVTGLLRTKGVGYVYEEWLRDLSTYRQKQIYREMRDNDPVIGAMFFALEMILRKAEWIVEPAKTKKGEEYAQFLKECMEDMSHTWEDFISECVSQFAFGFALFETVYKRRKGTNGKQSSRFNDGLIGWRKFAPRSQESILYWMWDDDGGLQGAVQLAAPDYATIGIPIEKLLLFRTTSIKNNPEGRSLLRNCYRPWFFKRRIEEIEGIGIERDLCGIPVLSCSGEALAALGGMQVAKNLVTGIRVDDMAGVVLPLAYDEKGNPLIKLELMKAAGTKQTDPGAAIQRYNSDMLNTILAGFIQLGQTPTGSFSLHMSASQIFAQAIGAFMDGTASVINRIAIPRLMSLNNMDMEDAPKLVPGEIGVRDLDELSGFVQRLAMSGLTFFDNKTANYLRKTARLPELPEDEEGLNQDSATPGQQLPGQKPGMPVVQNQNSDPNAPPTKDTSSSPPQKTWGTGNPKKKPTDSSAPTSQKDSEDKLQRV